MTTITNKTHPLVYFIDQYWEDMGDPRVNHWPLVEGGICRIFMIMAGYLIITMKVLPTFIKNRRAYQLTGIMLFYNTFMVIFNSIGFCIAVYAMNFGKLLLDFKYPSNEDQSIKTIFLLNFVWYFMVSRLLDLLDTVFMVLRKKDSQITPLHLYHHTVVPFICWLSLKYNAMIPIVWLFILFNTAIHSLMYGYYALSALGPSVKPYLWWKRHLTLLQIIQFFICGSYGVVLFIKQTDYPMDWFYLVVGQNPIFFFLFFDFYKQTYNQNIQKKPKNKL